MLHPELSVQSCRLGRGVFARTCLPLGTILWLPCDGCQVWESSSLRALAEPTFRSLDELGYYLEDGSLLLPCGGACFFNHSCEASVLDFGLDFGVSVRDIQAGEELYVDYRTFADDPGWEMVCRCGTRGCAGVVRPTDGGEARLRARWQGAIHAALLALQGVPQALEPVALRCSAVYRAVRNLSGIPRTHTSVRRSSGAVRIEHLAAGKA